MQYVSACSMDVSVCDIPDGTLSAVHQPVFAAIRAIQV